MNAIDTINKTLVTLAGRIRQLETSMVRPYIHQQMIIPLQDCSIVAVNPYRYCANDVGSAAVIEELYIAVDTAPAVLLRVKIQKNGVNILTGVTNYIQVNAGAHSSSRTANFTNQPWKCFMKCKE